MKLEPRHEWLTVQGVCAIKSCTPRHEIKHTESSLSRRYSDLLIPTDSADSKIQNIVAQLRLCRR